MTKQDKENIQIVFWCGFIFIALILFQWMLEGERSERVVRAATKNSDTISVYQDPYDNEVSVWRTTDGLICASTQDGYKYGSSIDCDWKGYNP